MTIYAQSGSANDIQAAINQAISQSDEEVVIPSGDFEFNPSPLDDVDFNVPNYVLTIRGAGVGNTTLRMTSQPSEGYGMFSIRDTLRNGGSVRVTDITFKGYVDPSAVYATVGVGIASTTDFRIDHCEFLDFESCGCSSANTGRYSEHRGLVDNCTFDNPFKDDLEYTGSKMWGYGVIFVSGYEVGAFGKSVDYYLGQYDGKDDITYVEDCTFTRCRHATSSNQSAWYVVRHCEFHDIRPFNYGHVDVHGSSGENTSGGRGLEAYDNTFVSYDGNNNAFWIRGGGGVILDNIYQGDMDGVELYKDSEPFKVQDLYIWDNTPEDVADYDAYTEGVDYFVGIQYPEYTPYTYPHSLIGNGGNGGNGQGKPEKTSLSHKAWKRKSKFF